MSNEIFTFPDGRMDTDNASRYLGISKKTLAQWRSDGDKTPPYIKKGRIFYFKEDLDSWLTDQGKHTSTAQERVRKKKKEKNDDKNN